MKTVGQIAAEWKEEEEAKKRLAKVTAERDQALAALERIEKARDSIQMDTSEWLQRSFVVTVLSQAIGPARKPVITETA